MTKTLTADYASAMLAGRLQKGNPPDSRQRLSPSPPVRRGARPASQVRPIQDARNPLGDVPGLVVAPGDRLIINDGGRVPPWAVAFALADLTDRDLRRVGVTRAQILAAVPQQVVG